MGKFCPEKLTEAISGCFLKQTTVKWKVEGL